MKKVNMLKSALVLIIPIALVLSGCQSNNDANDRGQTNVINDERSDDPSVQKGQELLNRCVKAHGGMAQWQKFDGLEYVMINHGDTIHQLTQLKDRRAHLQSKDFEIGYDGEFAWALPDTSKVPGNSPAFYYNLDFYFIAIPFVIKDPGVFVTYAGKNTLGGKEYETLKVGFGSGVGLTPKDTYYMYLDPETYIFKVLAYSITYFGEDSPVNTAKVYSDWVKVQGLLMPIRMENFEWNEGVLGESKHHLRIFKDIHFLEKITDETQFNVPTGAFKEKV
ncbi:MAG: DUF6503 family protein [Bacteroidota bacterium]